MRERQVSFAGGELSPTLWGRTDLARYPTGARRLRNFMVTPHGILENRPGTALVDAFVPGSSVDGVSRLVMFPASPSDFALLVFTAGRIGIYELGTEGNLTLVSTRGSPYGASDLSSLRFAQVGYVLTIVNETVGPYEFRRTPGYGAGTGAYTFSAMSFDLASFPYNDTGFVKLFKQTSTPAFAGDASHPAREWTWSVTRIMRRYSDGTLYETAAANVEEIYDTGILGGGSGRVPSEVAIYPDWSQQLALHIDAGTPAATADSWVATRIYRGREGVFGYVGQTTSTFFRDDGADPDFSNPPPQGVNPFKVYDANGALLRTECPTVVAFFENRRYFAATPERPSFIWGSAVDDYNNFDEVILADESDSLSFGLASNRSEKVRALVPRRQLLALTSAAEWLITGAGQGELVTPLSIAAHPVTEHGSGGIAPVSINSTVFHVQAKGTTPRALVFGPDAASYQSVDVSLLSRHLFQGHSIVDWAYAADPYSILWVVRNDGRLLSLTYIPEQEMVAWAQHDLADNAVVESIATVPQGGEDVVYVVVRRGSNQWCSLERLTSRLVSDVRESTFLDRCVTYNGRTSLSGITATVTDGYSTGGQVGEDVKVEFNDDNPTTIPSVPNYTGKVIQFDDPGGGDPVRLSIVALLAAPGAVTGAIYQATVIESDLPGWIWGAQQDEWMFCVNSIGGLNHLEGLGVTALIDGNVVEDLIVSGGCVDLGGYAAFATVGRPYVSEFESLAAINQRGQQKITKEVILEVEGSRGGAIGPDLDHLTEVRTRDVDDSFGPSSLKREEIRMPVSDRWSATGYVAFRQSSPLPSTILGITRDLVDGG